MNLDNPPESCDRYSKELYRFLQHPAFDHIALRPRSNEPGTTPDGQLYYDESGDLYGVAPGSGEHSTLSNFSFAPTNSILVNGHVVHGHFYGVLSGTDMSPDFSVKNSWEEMDLSPYVPSSAQAVAVNIATRASAMQDTIRFRPLDSSAITSALRMCNHCLVQSDGSGSSPSTIGVFEMKRMTIQMPSDGSCIIEYNKGTSNYFTVVIFTIIGWWK